MTSASEMSTNESESVRLVSLLLSGSFGSTMGKTFVDDPVSTELLARITPAPRPEKAFKTRF